MIDFNKGVPKLAVTGRKKATVGECAACGDSPEMLTWREKDLGAICRNCAKLLIAVELAAIFPNFFEKSEEGPEA